MKTKYLMVSLFPIILGSCNNTITPEELNIIGPEFICINKDFNYKIESNPINAKKDVTWSIEDESIATINQDGLFHPISKGEVKLNIKSKINENIKGSLSIKIYDELTTNDEFLNNYEKNYNVLITKQGCNASIKEGDYTIQTYGKVTSFYDTKFANGTSPSFNCKYKDIDGEKEYRIPILNKTKLKENFDSIEKYKKETGKNGELLCKIDETGVLSYFSYLENNNTKLYEYKSFDNEGYLIRYKQVLGDNQNLQTIDNFHISYTK